MDYRRDSSAVQIVPTNGPPENWITGSDQPVWATEDDYGDWNRETSVDATSNSNYETQSGSEPPNKKSRNGQTNNNDPNRAKAIGKMFFKTKLCCKFRAGTCPYITNCNFAHSIEELRRPPPNWQEIVAAHEDERGPADPPLPREEFQIPALDSSSFAVETPRSYKGRHCKKFYTEEGCPYGDSCTFLHDEQSRSRESVAISLGPSGGYGGGGGGGGSGGGGGVGGGSAVVVVGGGGVGAGGGGGSGGSSGVIVVGGGAASSVLKPSNWKTRICNKWEQTGYCPFGSKCHFAHGTAELHRYGGGLMESDMRDISSSFDPKNGSGTPSKNITDTVIVGAGSVSHMGLPSQRISNAIQRTGLRPHQKWKGPDKISLIYGDWIEDLE